MKSRSRHVGFGDTVDPSAFDYTLLNHVYIHDDGNDVIDFGGYTTKQESKHEVQELLRNHSFARPGAGSHMETPLAPPETASPIAPIRAPLLHMQGDDEEGVFSSTTVTPAVTPLVQPAVAPSTSSPPPRHASRLVSIEDKENHMWLITQSAEDHPPYARMFPSADSLFQYFTDRGLEVPTRGQRRRRPRVHVPAPVHTSGALAASSERDRPASPVDRLPGSTARHTRSSLPVTKWIDIQSDPSDPQACAALRDVLSRFPLSEETIDNCTYLARQDFVDTSHLTSWAASYVFFILTCTPLKGLDYSGSEAAKAAAAAEAAKHRRHGIFRRRRGHGAHQGAGESSPPCAGNGGPDAPSPVLFTRTSNAKSVMELRFEAVKLHLPRSAVPEPVPVAVIAFADWIITVHEAPFAEMDDLLRVIHLHCSPRLGTALSINGTLAPSALAATATAHFSGANSASPQRRFTSALVFSNLLQISIGHHIDSIALAHAVDELGDVVFDIKATEKEQEVVLQHITAVRRCFGECGADVARREHVVSTLLQPSLAHNFLLSDPNTAEQLQNVLAHMRYVQHELNDCRDTVAVSNWYHNVAMQWILLRRGSRALRMVLQLTEMGNIMYPIITLQTLYAIQVHGPFYSDGEHPNNSLLPFFITAAIIIIYAVCCLPAVYRIFHRKALPTKLLA